MMSFRIVLPTTTCAVLHINTMKAATLVIFAVLIVAVTCRPDKDLKQLKAEAAQKKACLRDCSSAQLEPICAGKPGQKPVMSFGNECVMNNYNCEHKDTLQKVSAGACPGSHGIRLS